MRLDQYIQLALGVSRRDAQRLLRCRAITLNDREITQGKQRIDPESDTIHYQGELLQYDNAPSYFVFNKPAGYVSSHRDDGYPSLFRLLEDELQSLHIAGRLDADTTGLVILTDDGDFSHYLTHPKRDIPKHYSINLAEPITPEAIKSLESGLYLRGESEKTLPATVIIHTPLNIDLIISEGRYHQVKRMLASVGNRVKKLHRYQIGAVDLTGLKEGHYRSLSESEIESFYE